tara:strand:+ start:76 stop:507 length:432 start_codon:yes stop_codon:yes gene_type:complete
MSSVGSRYLNQFQLTLEKDTVTLFGSFQCTSGVVTAYQGGGIASIEQTATGAYDITLQDGWNWFFDFKWVSLKPTASEVAAIQLTNVPTDITADIKAKVPLSILCLDFAGSEVDPADTEVIKFEIKARRTSVGPFDDGYGTFA